MCMVTNNSQQLYMYDIKKIIITKNKFVLGNKQQLYTTV